MDISMLVAFIPPTLRWFALGIGMIGTGILPLSLFAAEGTRLIGTGPVQTSTAGAGVASPQNASWLSLNPAGLVTVSDRADVSTDIIQGRATLTPNGGLGNSSAGRIEDEVIVYAPAAAVVHKLSDHDTLALGFYTVSGLAIGYPESRSGLGSSGGFDRRAEQRFVTTSAAYARRITEQLAAALTCNLNYVDLRSDTITYGLTQTSGQFEMDSALGAGFSISLFQQGDQLNFGVIYKSRQWMETLERYRDAFVGTPDQPQVFQCGVAWRPLTWFEPMLDYRYIDWRSVAFYGEGLGWRDQHVIKLATNFQVNEKLTVRTGLSYGRSPISESVVFINGLSPLISEWHATLGFSWQVTKTWDLQCCYLHAFKNTLTDNGDDVSGFGAGTEISLVVDSLILGVGWQY
jgi:long-chain fatty acid transport protein